MRPRLKPALRRLDRDGRTVQFGVHPPHAVMLTGVEPAVRDLLDALDGTRTAAEISARAGRRGLGGAAVRATLDLLARHGLLDDGAVRRDALRSMDVAERDRLTPDLAALSLAPDAADGGLGAMLRRRAAHVRVYGAGRVGAQVAVLLAAAGVGNLCVIDAGIARRCDVVPGGLGWGDVGGRREDGAVAAALRVAPSLNAWTGRAASHPADWARPPDLAVLAPVTPLDDALPRELGERGVPHLLATAFEGSGLVGPLVLPGRTCCLRCLDLTRRDNDPAWPLLIRQLGGFPPGEHACGTVLSTLVAAATAGHALSFLDGPGTPRPDDHTGRSTGPGGRAGGWADGDGAGREHVLEGRTLDVLPGQQWRGRSWEVHPQCGCMRKESLSPTMVA